MANAYRSSNLKGLIVSVFFFFLMDRSGRSQKRFCTSQDSDDADPYFLYIAHAIFCCSGFCLCRHQRRCCCRFASHWHICCPYANVTMLLYLPRCNRCFLSRMLSLCCDSALNFAIHLLPCCRFA